MSKIFKQNKSAINKTKYFKSSRDNLSFFPFQIYPKP